MTIHPPIVVCEPTRCRLWGLLRIGALLLAAQNWCFAQSVGLPAPRLLTTMPMGGQVGTQVSITITGEHLDDAEELLFSEPKLSATRKLDAAGQPIANQYEVSIAADCPSGLYEARIRTRLGVSSSRIFSVGTLPEVTQTPGNTTLEKAQPLAMNSLCNAVMSGRSADFYTFEGRKGQRVLVDCASRGIDSKLEAVVIIADAAGRDRVVERRGGVLDFTVPDDGRYVIKVHELTYRGGPAFYYRLAVQELTAEAVAVRHPATRAVCAASWPPTGLPVEAALTEVEPNDTPQQVQKITLPCDITGRFAQAADVDLFEFAAQQGEVWWIEVASERLGRPTDPNLIVQQVTGTGAEEQLTDVLELTDIPSPVKVSSNGYAYDGPAYNAGSSDILGKLEIKTTGTYRLQLSDLFGGTRTDPQNVYRLVIRRAAPDFAVVAWALHMELRNGDRNAVSKPLSLRGGATMALEVVAVRRDGFDGEIELTMEGLPAGVTARGIKIPAGQSRGIMLVTAASDAPRSFTSATFQGRATINETPVTHPCPVASFAWPITDSWSEIPSPRLLADIPVSVSGVDLALLTIAPAQATYEAVAGQQLTIPLQLTRRTEFQGATLNLRPICTGMPSVPAFDLTLAAESPEVVIDLAALKTPPGEYVLAFHGGAVAKYRHHPEAIAAAEEAKRLAEQTVMSLEAEAQQLAAATATVTPEQKSASDQTAAALAEKQKAAQAALAAATERLKQATATAEPKDIVDIVVTEPISIRVKPAEAP